MFYSILFPDEKNGNPVQKNTPDCFRDLNLDQIINPVLDSAKTFELEGFFYTPLHDRQTIIYRQDILRELEDDRLRIMFADFSRAVHDINRGMFEIRKVLSPNENGGNYLVKGHMLENAEKYCGIISSFLENAAELELQSAGLGGFLDYLDEYCNSAEYTGLCTRTKYLRAEFSKIQYCMLIKNDTIRVRKYEGQADHSGQILDCFEKFRQGNVKNYSHQLSGEPSAVHVEEAVLKMLSRYHKRIFGDLDEFCSQYLNFHDRTIVQFSREIQFYLSWLELITPLRKSGLHFCYPQMTEKTGSLFASGCFDLALARIKKNNTVANDFIMNKPEHIIVITGPNQGGKTTYARSIGQIHYLASLGLCVPGREALLYLFDEIYTHFGHQEDPAAFDGRLQDDLIRLRSLLDAATNRSIIIVNEIYTSTALNDSILLGKRMMDAFIALGAPAVVVTFLDELAVHGPAVISMMSTVEEENPAQRTFRIVRKPPDGLAYAMHIAGKYGLTCEQLGARLAR